MLFVLWLSICLYVPPSLIYCHLQELGTCFRWYNFIYQHDFYWFFISLSYLSKYHAYCFAGGKCQAPFAAHVSSLLVTSCRSMAATLWFLVIMYIARSYAKSVLSTPFPKSPNIPLIATRRRVALSTPPCGTPKSVYLFCEMDPPTLTLIHLLEENYCCFLFSPESIKNFFYIASIVFLCFLKPNCLSSIFFSLSRYQTSLLIVILSNILQSIFVRATGL